jgi:hypothetical protein
MIRRCATMIVFAALVSAASIAVYAAVKNDVNEIPLGEGVKTGNDYFLVTLDSCEYIIIKRDGLNGPSITVTHKGNCNNPVHQVK